MGHLHESYVKAAAAAVVVKILYQTFDKHKVHIVHGINNTQ